MKHSRSLLVLALALMGATVLAQVAPPVDGPAAPRPQGGPERGPRPSPLGGGGLLLNPRVVAELRLTDAQKAAIIALAPRTPAERGPGEPRPNAAPPRPPQDVSPPRKAPNDGPEERIEAILNPDQRARFRQLRLQHEGAGAIRRPDVAKALGLTDEQIATLRPTPPAPPKEGEAPRPPKDGSRPDPRAEDARLLDRLTDAQRETWRSMLGQPFDFGEEAAPKPNELPSAPPKD